MAAAGERQRRRVWASAHQALVQAHFVRELLRLGSQLLAKLLQAAESLVPHRSHGRAQGAGRCPIAQSGLASLCSAGGRRCCGAPRPLTTAGPTTSLERTRHCQRADAASTECSDDRRADQQGVSGGRRQLTPLESAGAVQLNRGLPTAGRRPARAGGVVTDHAKALLEAETPDRLARRSSLHGASRRLGRAQPTASLAARRT